jgi:hypothetical protein
LVAPVIDRLRNAIARSAMAHVGALGREFGVGEAGAVTMAMLRNALPVRAVTRQQVHAVLAYLPPARVEAGISEALAAGLLVEADALGATERGGALLVRIHALVSDFVSNLWAGHEDRVDSLLALTAPVLEAAAETGGPAWAVMAPPYEPAGATAAMRLAERLTPLRFHRYDAHVAAWKAEGLRVEEVQALAAGPVRDRIERETNRRAAPPYAALDPTGRLELLAGLGALPN